MIIDKDKVLNDIFGLKRRKYKNILVIFILTIEIFLFVIMFSNNYNNTVSKKLVYNRTLIAVDNLNRENNDAFQELNSFNNVEATYNIFPNIYIKDNNNNSYILEYINLPSLKIIKGKKLYEINNNEIIIPNTLDLKINDILEIYINGKNYKLIIAGIYDSIIGLENILVSKQFIEENYSSFPNEYGVIVTNYDYVSNVINEISKYDFSINIKNTKGLEILKNYQSIIKLLIIFLSIIMIFVQYIIILSINDIINESKNEIAIMKVSGFKDKKIVYLVLVNILKELFISLIKASIVLEIINIVFNYIFGFQYNILIICVLTLLIILLSLTISTSNTYLKIKKIVPIHLFRKL